MSYAISVERGDLNYRELEPLYRQHYQEMKTRLEADGLEVSDYNPRLDKYFEAFAGGWLLNYVVRLKGKPVGYSNIYLTNDMHNGDFIAREDLLYVLPHHRNGTGRQLVKFILADLKSRGVKRGYVTPVTDLRVAPVWRRMGFKDVASLMVYEF